MLQANFSKVLNLNFVLLVGLLVWCCFVAILSETKFGEKHDVALRDSMLLVSTLDGSLHAVSQRTGSIKWSLTENAPILQMSPIVNISEDAKHLMLPDPKDGSLYLFNGLRNDNKLKTLEKLPFTISELVSTSPCRSSDGLIYTSKKVDEWMIVDVKNGQKVDVINVDSPMCQSKTTRLPDSSSDSHQQQQHEQNNLLHLFKSEYQISIFNSDSREKLLNFTFNDYSASMISTIAQSSYEFLHLASSNNGKIATIEIGSDQKSFLWSQQFGTPVVAVYKLTENANFPVIHRLPFYTLGGLVNLSTFFGPSPLFPSVYIGELADSNSLYALSALVENNHIRKDYDLLIEGPKVENSNSVPFFLDKRQILGYHEYPKKKTDIKFSLIPGSELIPSIVRSSFDFSSSNRLIGKIESVLPSASVLLPDVENTFWRSSLFLLMIVFVSILIFGLLFATVLMFLAQQKLKNKKSIVSNSNNQSSITIGKITYNPNDIIGRGCSGTCVYKGMFEQRQSVAVKRIVSACFERANREIEVLNKLEHPNLVRYFATEQGDDGQFQYIALELAEMTLADYIEGSKMSQNIGLSSIELLHQACVGLAHLHSQGIIHRDIKPQNILISTPSKNNQRKVMITDFNFSKILNSETVSKTSFLAGTDGWMSPEILKYSSLGPGDKSNISFNIEKSKLIDIFSMGCLIYYTVTNGKHPFGQALQRQTNIANGFADLSLIYDNEEHCCLYSLVEPMIAINMQDRPPIDVVVKHPFFWNSKQQLQFLQDVSDRFECEAYDSELVKILETGALDVCRGDWRRWISVELQEDLRKFRSYKGNSVRDLLRAIRNKRHHYHELDQKLQQALGSIPNDFIQYFTKRFPRLIIHSYLAMQHCANEPLFEAYYSTQHSPQANNNNFRFRNLPRSSIRWIEKLKEADAAQNNISAMPSPFTNNNSSKVRQRNLNNKKPKPTTTTLEQTENHSDDSPKKSSHPIHDNNNSDVSNGDNLLMKIEQVEEAPSSLFYNDVFKC